MADASRDLESKALNPPSKDRDRLAERLFASLQGVPDPEAEVLCLARRHPRRSRPTRSPTPNGSPYQRNGTHPNGTLSAGFLGTDHSSGSWIEA